MHQLPESILEEIAEEAGLAHPSSKTLFAVGDEAAEALKKAAAQQSKHKIKTTL